MKSIVTFALAVLLAVAAVPRAEAQNARDTLEVLRSEVLADRKAVVAEAMGLTETESAAFWPVYDEYQTAVNSMRKRRMDIILDYAGAYPNVTDEKAGELLASHLALKKDWAEVEAKFVDKFKKVLPAKKVARYYQIENKIDAIINYELAAQIPMVR